MTTPISLLYSLYLYRNEGENTNKDIKQKVPQRGRGRKRGVDFIDPISTRTRSQNNIPIERGKFFSIGINMFAPIRKKRFKTDSTSSGDAFIDKRPSERDTEIRSDDSDNEGVWLSDKAMPIQDPVSSGSDSDSSSDSDSDNTSSSSSSSSSSSREVTPENNNLTSVNKGSSEGEDMVQLSSHKVYHSDVEEFDSCTESDEEERGEEEGKKRRDSELSFEELCLPISISRDSITIEGAKGVSPGSPEINVTSPPIETPKVNVTSPVIETPIDNVSGPCMGQPIANVTSPYNAPKVNVTSPHMESPSNLTAPFMEPSKVNLSPHHMEIPKDRTSPFTQGQVINVERPTIGPYVSAMPETPMTIGTSQLMDNPKNIVMEKSPNVNVANFTSQTVAGPYIDTQKVNPTFNVTGPYMESQKINPTFNVTGPYMETQKVNPTGHRGVYMESLRVPSPKVNMSHSNPNSPYREGSSAFDQSVRSPSLHSTHSRGASPSVPTHIQSSLSSPLVVAMPTLNPLMQTQVTMTTTPSSSYHPPMYSSLYQQPPSYTSTANSRTTPTPIQTSHTSPYQISQLQLLQYLQLLQRQNLLAANNSGSHSSTSSSPSSHSVFPYLQPYNYRSHSLPQLTPLPTSLRPLVPPAYPWQQGMSAGGVSASSASSQTTHPTHPPPPPVTSSSS